MNNLEKELKELENKVAELKSKIKQQEEMKNINEIIARGHIKKTEDVTFIQYIDKKKINLQTHGIKEKHYDITYTRKGNKIICEFGTIFYRGVGVAKCHPNDEFDYFEGIIIAELRARSDFYKKVADDRNRHITNKNNIK